MRLSKPTLATNHSIVLRSGCHDNWFLRPTAAVSEGNGGPEGTHRHRARPGKPGPVVLPARPEHGNGHPFGAAVIRFPPGERNRARATTAREPAHCASR